MPGTTTRSDRFEVARRAFALAYRRVDALCGRGYDRPGGRSDPLRPRVLQAFAVVRHSCWPRIQPMA